MSDAWKCPPDRFPIGPSTPYGKPKLTVPLALVLEHEQQARTNHGQSVARLKERGGLSWCELSAVLDDRACTRMDLDVAHERAMGRVLDWQRRASFQPDAKPALAVSANGATPLGSTRGQTPSSDPNK